MLFAELIFLRNFLLSHFHPNIVIQTELPSVSIMSQISDQWSHLFTDLSHLAISSPWEFNLPKEITIKKVKATHELKEEIKNAQLPSMSSPKVPAQFCVFGSHLHLSSAV